MRSYSKKHFKRSKIIRRLINGVQSFRQATSLAPNAWSAMLIRSVLRPGSQRFILDVFLAFVNHSRYNSLEGRPQGSCCPLLVVRVQSPSQAYSLLLYFLSHYEPQGFVLDSTSWDVTSTMPLPVCLVFLKMY